MCPSCWASAPPVPSPAGSASSSAPPPWSGGARLGPVPGRGHGVARGAVEPSRRGDPAAGRSGQSLRRRGSAPGRCVVESMRARRWCARGSLALVAAAFVVLLVFADRRGLWLLLLTVASVVVVVAGLFWFLRQRGPVRWLALILALGAPVAVLAVFVADRLLWVAVVAAVLLAAGIAVAHTALR